MAQVPISLRPAMPCPVLTYRMVLRLSPYAPTTYPVHPQRIAHCYTPALAIRCPVLTWRICLRPCYAMSGTDAAYGATRTSEHVSYRYIPTSLRPSYAISGPIA
eukprot:1526712-Rhodomonas_salina.1